MIVTSKIMTAIRDVYGSQTTTDEAFAREVIILLCAGYYELQYKKEHENLPVPLADAVCSLVGKTGKIDYEPLYCNFDDGSFVTNFIEYCFKKDYDTALQNLLYFCGREIKNFEDEMQSYIVKMFTAK